MVRFGMMGCAGLAAALLAGCAAVRMADHALPAIRVDQPPPRPLPPDHAPATAAARTRWAAQGGAASGQYPTLYHAYTQTPAPGSFEGRHTIGLAFSGGGTRGVVFGAACVAELAALGPIVAETADGPIEIDVLGEVDYVSGVSTGSVPAALFALDAGGRCPPDRRMAHWPEGLNADLNTVGFTSIALRPDWWVRDYLVDINTHAAAAGALAHLFFNGNRFRPASGLTFGDLPETPVLLIGAAVIEDPGGPFVFTRLPYRHALDPRPEYPWQVDVQSFETFHIDPMAFPLSEACYASLSYPGMLRALPLRIEPARAWWAEGLDDSARARMARAMHQPLWHGVYGLKDGGLADNRGTYLIWRIFRALEGAPSNPVPLLMSVDAGRLPLRLPEPGPSVAKQGWLAEFTAAMRTTYQTGQSAFDALVEETMEHEAMEFVRIAYSAWVPHLPPEAIAEVFGGAVPAPPAPDPAARHMLESLCAAEPHIATPARLLEVAAGLGTHFAALRDEELAAVRIAAKFAVWRVQPELLAWASARHGGASTRFQPAHGNPVAPLGSKHGEVE